MLLLLLAACAPRATEPQTHTAIIQGPVGFYPSQPGLDWIYQPQRASLADPPFRLSIIGPTSFAGQPAIRFRFSGRGQERNFFRQVGPTGVRLLGFEEVISNSTVRFNPPLQEYPAENTLVLGARWGGVSRLESQIVVNNQVTQTAAISLEYTYQVVGKTNVTVGAGAFEAWRITLQIKPAQGDVENFEIWFVPGVGEVRTREGLLLVDRNFR
jgi:hypothetical protein